MKPTLPDGHTTVSKLLFLILAAVAVYLVFAGASRRRERHAELRPETMVPCAYCGIHLPRSEALEVDGRYFCGQEHRDLGPA
jgi:uncharacterized protein